MLIKKLIPVLTVILLAVTACKKTSSNSVNATNPLPFAGCADSIWGVMECDSFSISNEYFQVDSSRNAFASFKDNSGAYTSAGNVTCNGATLFLQNALINPMLYFTATAPLLFNYAAYKSSYKFGTAVPIENPTSWRIQGAGSVPAISYDFNAPFPQYLDTLPSYITRSAGLTILLGANVVGAD